MRFELYPLRFEFTAREAIFFPPGKAANLLRGAFGMLFRKLACAPECTGPRTCAVRDSCPYARVFQPAASSGVGPSGLADWPRPFVFRARHLDGRTVVAGEPFWFGLNLFALDQRVLAYFVRAFASLAIEGLGPTRGTALLDRVISGGEVWSEGSTGAPLSLELAPAGAVDRIRVTFLTPTELKHGNRTAERPEFAILFGRLRDRIGTLSRLYGETLDIDYTGTNARAAAVQMTGCRVQHEQIVRRSSQTGQVHSIGGFVGAAEYEGELAEFLPFLKVGRWVGVGRQAVWGKGEIAVEVISPLCPR